MSPVWQGGCPDFVEARVRVQTTPHRSSLVGAVLALLFGLAGCGGSSSLTAPQTEALQSGLDLNLAVREECSDAGPCKPSRVRAMEYGAYCAIGGVLASLGSPPDAGIVCPSAAK